MKIAKITDYQSAKVLKGNPKLIELRQRECFDLVNKTFKILAVSKVRRQLETLHLARSDKIDEGIP